MPYGLGMLVVLRGNSGSGKSTVARLLQAELGWPTAVLQQDHFRRVIYRERGHEGLAHADLLETAAMHCLGKSHNVVLDGIFDARRYGAMLKQIATSSADARFFAFDLTFEETVRRHAQRLQATEFTVDDMRGWYHGWQPLDFIDEQRIGPEDSPRQIVARVLRLPTPSSTLRDHTEDAQK